MQQALAKFREFSGEVLQSSALFADLNDDSEGRHAALELVRADNSLDPQHTLIGVRAHLSVLTALVGEAGSGRTTGRSD